MHIAQMRAIRNFISNADKPSQGCENNCGALPHAFARGTALRPASLSRLARAVVAGMLLMGQASAETFVTDLPLEDVGSQRVLYAAPANPRAALVMLPGGNGMVEIGNDGSIRRMGGSFLLRTLPLWQAQGFAVVVLTPPNGMSLLGYRHTPAYAANIAQAVDFVASRANVPVWLVGASQGSTAAVNGGARLGGKVAGIILLSSVTAPQQFRRNLVRQRAGPRRRAGADRRQ